MGCLETRLEQVKRSRTFYADVSRCEVALNANFSLLCSEFGPSQQPQSLGEVEQFKKKLQVGGYFRDENGPSTSSSFLSLNYFVHLSARALYATCALLHS